MEAVEMKIISNQSSIIAKKFHKCIQILFHLFNKYAKLESN